MASGIRETTKPQLEIYLEKPWGGVASNANPVDIADNQFVAGQGVIDVDGVLCAVSLVAPATNFKFNSHVSNAVPMCIFNLNGSLYAVDQFGNMYVLGIGAGPVFPTSFNFLTAATDGPWTTFPNGAIVVQVVNGIAYVAVPARNSIYTFTGTVFAIASNYTGGNILGVLDDYLLQMNTNDSIDGLQPTRVNWSGPGEFSTWDPAIDRTAGFNTLANIEDAITGFISLASVGIIIGQKELVEASPTGIGIKPFSFTVLWASEVGQGILYPNTVTQYGQSTYAGTDTGIFKISTGGFQEVSGNARTAILQPVQESAISFPGATDVNPAFFAGNILLYAFNSTYPTPHYVFVETSSITGPGEFTTITLWFLNLETGSWFSSIVVVDTLVNSQNAQTQVRLYLDFIKVASVTTLGFASNLGFNNLPNLLIYGGARNNTTGVDYPFVGTILTFTAANVVTSIFTPSPLNITSKAFELKLGRQPTIRRIVVKAFGTGVLSVSVNNVLFGTITLDGTSNMQTYYTPKGIFTGEDPQINITSANFIGVIVKVMATGTYADGDID